MVLKKIFLFTGLAALSFVIASFRDTTTTPLIIAFIDQLREGESYSIKFQSHGCFHYTEDSITVKKEEDSFFASHANGAFKLLDKNEIVAMRLFEQRLQQPFEGSCTTVDEYILTTPEGSFLIGYDESCQWRGWYDLKASLGWP
jgi:hypothetical protein